MEKERTVKEVFGIDMWIGNTSGGWGNGPYREYFTINETKPEDEIISHAQDSRESDVVLIWRPARLRDLNTRPRVRNLFPFSFRRERQVDYIIREYNLPCELSKSSLVYGRRIL